MILGGGGGEEPYLKSVSRAIRLISKSWCCSLDFEFAGQQAGNRGRLILLRFY